MFKKKNNELEINNDIAMLVKEAIEKFLKEL